MNVARKTVGLSMLLTLAVGGLNVAEAGAAPAGPSKAHLRHDAAAVLYGASSNYAYYKSVHPKALNWTHDGCSVPKSITNVPGVGSVLKHYSKVFNRACNYHDFGYRNYGAATKTKPRPKLQPTAARRKSIDRRLLTLMSRACKSKYSHWYQIPARGLCYDAASLFYGAVRAKGGSSFYA